jgi:hypothetical protein
VPWRQTHAPFETPLWQLKTVDYGGPQCSRQNSTSRDRQITIVDQGLNLLRINAGKSQKHKNLILGFEHIGRRLPSRQAGS